ncbi:MAG: hypothetical protein LBS36_03365 [Oscillospiraceae bacterium]|jgi:hypothetical protein|nr:hypothetical protein [Oscillospiraceae bacterium]
MSKYDNAMKYAEISTNSAGSALEKYENSYLKSVAASQDKFNASMEQFSTSLINSDLIKSTFDTGSGILGFLNSAVKTLGEIPSLAAIAGAALAAMNKGWRIERDIICPLQSGGDAERVIYKCGVFNKGLYSKRLKWCDQ